jgi:transcriptional regulator with XRE-family HTH domain
MTQRELADRLGVSSNYIHQLETGRKENLGDLTEMRLRTLEESPIYKSPNWRTEEVTVRGTNLTIHSLPPMHSLGSPRPEQPSESDPIDLLISLLETFKTSTGHARRWMAKEIRALAEKLESEQ